MNKFISDHDTTLTIQTLSWPKIDYAPSVFTAHQLPPGSFRTREHQPFQPDWILGVLVLCFILVAWAQVFYHNRIRQIFKAPISKRFMNQLVREGNLLNERVSVALGIIFLLTGSLLLYEIKERLFGFNFFGIQNITLYLCILVGLLGYWAIKFLLVRFLGIVFKTRDSTYQYMLNLLVFCLITGPVILIFLVFIVYMKSDFLLYCALVIFSIFFIFRVLRGFYIGMGLRKFSFLFLFVYLCSLEILPLLVLVKLLLGYTHP